MSKEQEILDQLVALDEQYKTSDKQRIKEAKDFGDQFVTNRESLDNIDSEIKRLESEFSGRMDDLESKADAPLRERDGITNAERDHLKAFDLWVRDPRSHEKQADLQYAAKAVQTTTDSAGGHAVPEVISTAIGQKVQDISAMRGLVRVQTVGTSDYKELIDVGGEASGWIGETGTRSETGTPQLEQCAPTMGTLYAYPKATEESLDDMFFNVEDWLVRKTAISFAKAEGLGFISGDGSNKMTGFLNGTPVSTVDDGVSPERAYQTLQYLPTGAAGAFSNGPLDSPIGYAQSDVFIDAEMALKPEYRSNGVYLMNKSTLGTVRKLKDADGNFIWSRSLILGVPSTINGYSVIEMPDMPDIAANSLSIAFGDFNEGYLAVDRVGLRMTLDDVTTPGYVKYYIRRRQGGTVYNDDAIKVIKFAAS